MVKDGILGAFGKVLLVRDEGLGRCRDFIQILLQDGDVVKARGQLGPDQFQGRTHFLTVLRTVNHPLHGERDHDAQNHGQEIAEEAQDEFFHRLGSIIRSNIRIILKKKKKGPANRQPLMLIFM